MNFFGYTENTWSSDEFNIFIFHLSFLLQRFSKTFSRDFWVHLNFKSLQNPHKTSIWSSMYVFLFFFPLLCKIKHRLTCPRNYLIIHLIASSFHCTQCHHCFQDIANKPLIISIASSFFLVSSDNKFRMMQLEIRR